MKLKPTFTNRPSTKKKKRTTNADQRKLIIDNTALKKKNKLFKEKLVTKVKKEKAVLLKHIKTDNTRNKKLIKIVEKENKKVQNSKTDNTRLQKSNKQLRLSNKQIVSKGIKEKGSFIKQIKSGNALNKKLEYTVKQGSVEVKRVKSILRKKDTEIDQLNKELLTFTYISSHDLQEPLRNIQVIANLILEKESNNLSKLGKDYFLRLQKSAKRIEKLIQDLIEYSNFNKKYFKVESTDLNKILIAVKKELKKVIREGHAKIKTSKLPTLTVSSSQFHKLFKELIYNAIKFSKPHVSPKIMINCKIIKGKIIKALGLVLRKTYYYISFEDNGIGFEPKFKNRIFEVFQQLHGKDYAGSGIGLATCRKIVENYGGKITAKSELGTGTIFDIYLPFKANKHV